VISVRPANFIGNDDLRGLSGLMNQVLPMLRNARTDSANLKEVMFVFYSANELGHEQNHVRQIYRFTDAGHQKNFVEALRQRPEFAQGPRSRAKVELKEMDATTVLCGPEIAFTAGSDKPPRWAQAWEERASSPIVAALDVKSSYLSTSLPFAWLKQGGPALPLMFSPLHLYVDWAVAGVEIGEKPQVTGIVACDKKTEVYVRDTLQALATVMQNCLRADRQAWNENRPIAGTIVATPAMRDKLVYALIELLGSTDLRIDRNRIHVAMSSPRSSKELGSLVSGLPPFAEETNKSGAAKQSASKIKQLALAMLLHEDTRGYLPPAGGFRYYANSKSQKSNYPHSWRVALLPFIDHEALFEQYKFDEPWDSEANKKILAQMPAVFRADNDAPDSTNTSYFVVTGPNTLFSDAEGTRIKSVVDGTAKTLMIVEAKRPVPWTKPEDISYSANQPVPTLGSWVDGQFLSATSDGVVRQLSTGIDDATLRAYLTKDGRENVGDLPATSSAP